MKGDVELCLSHKKDKKKKKESVSVSGGGECDKKKDLQRSK